MKKGLPISGSCLNQYDAQGFSPIHHAAQRGDINKIKQLVSEGADVMHCTKGRMKNILHIAILKGCEETVHFLVKHYPLLIDNEVFLEAIRYGQFGLVLHFLQSDLPLSYDNPNLMHFIVRQIRPGILLHFLNISDPKFDINGNSLLHTAVDAYRSEHRMNWKKMLKVIVASKKFEINHLNHFGLAPIHMGIRIPSVFHEVANHGADLCVMDRRSNTLVHYWVNSLVGSREKVQNILRRIISYASRKSLDIVNYPNQENIRPIYYALKSWQVDKICQLIYHGAEVSLCQMSNMLLSQDKPLSMRKRMIAYGQYDVSLPVSMRNMNVFISSIYGARFLAKVKNAFSCNRQKFQQLIITMLLVGNRIQSKTGFCVNDVWRIIMSYLRSYSVNESGYVYANTMSKDINPIIRVHPIIAKECSQYLNQRFSFSYR